MHNAIAEAPSKSEFVITRVVDAPRELVWQAHTQRERLMRWFGPKGYTMHAATLDLRRGGIFHYGLRAADGHEIWGKWVFREIVRPNKLVFILSFSNAEGGLTRLPLGPRWPLHTLTTLTFFENAGETTISVHCSALNANQAEQQSFDDNIDSMRIGWCGTFEQLEAYLAHEQALATQLSAEAPANDDEYLISRVLDAPRQQVFDAWIDPDQLSQWWGPHGYTNPACEIDARVGGAYRIVMRDADGTDYPVKGVYREILAPLQLEMTLDCSEHPPAWHDKVHPHRAQGDENPAGIMLQTATFADFGGKTLLTIRIRFESVWIRDALLQMGMREGWTQSLERLAQHLTASAPRQAAGHRGSVRPVSGRRDVQA